MRQQIISDMVAHVQSGVTDGQFRVIGQGAGVFSRIDQKSTQLELIAKDGPRDPGFESAFAIVRDDVSAPPVLSVDDFVNVSWYDANMHQQKR